MTPEKILSSSCANLARAIRSKELTALAAMEAVLEHAARSLQAA